MVCSMPFTAVQCVQKSHGYVDLSLMWKRALYHLLPYVLLMCVTGGGASKELATLLDIRTKGEAF